MLPPRTPPKQLHPSPNRSPFYPASGLSLTLPPRTILRSPMGPGDGQSWGGRNRSATSQLSPAEMGRSGKKSGKTTTTMGDQENTPSSTTTTTTNTNHLLATPTLSYTPSTPSYDSSFSSSSAYTNTSSTFSPQSPTIHNNNNVNSILLDHRRRTRSAFPFKPSSPPSPCSSPLSSSSIPFDQLAYELSPSFFASEPRSAYDGGPDEGAWLVVSEEEGAASEVARRRRSEGSLMDNARSSRREYSGWEEDEEVEEGGSSAGKTLTPSTPALPQTPKTPPQTIYSSSYLLNNPHTPPAQKGQLNQQQAFPTLHFFTPPPPASRRLVPTLPTAPASAPRTRMPRALSPFKELVFEVDEDDEEEEEEDEEFFVQQGPLTPERRTTTSSGAGGWLSGGGGVGERTRVQGESPPGGGDGSPPSKSSSSRTQQQQNGGGGWKPKLSGLSPSQREAKENASTLRAGAGVGGAGRIVTFGEEEGGRTRHATMPAGARRREGEPMGLGMKVEPRERDKSCGCCEETFSRDGVRVGPCGCEVCKKCFTSSMNIVCDVVGGVMRCPSCTIPVDSFAPFHPATSKTPSPPPLPPMYTPSQPQYQQHSSFFPTTTAFGAETNAFSQPILLRFDNASWDVTPEMITAFLPEGSLPDSVVNPHPIHLLIDPISGKTKDYFFVEVKSKKAAALIIKTAQGQVLGEGKRARRVTITLSNLMELRREIQPNSPRVLSGLLNLCETAFSTKKSFIKRRSFPFLYLLTILTRADLTGMETDILLAFQGATLILSAILESGAATADSISLSNQMVQVVARTSLLSPVVQGPFLQIIPGPTHPLARPPPPTTPTASFLFNQGVFDVYSVAAARGLRI